MIQVKLFFSSITTDLEKDINKWFQNNQSITLIEIKYNYNSYHSAMVVYKTC